MISAVTGGKPPGPASKTGASPLGKGGQGGKGSGSGKGASQSGKGGAGGKVNTQGHQVKYK